MSQTAGNWIYLASRLSKYRSNPVSMSRVVHSSVGWALGSIESCGARTERSRPLVVGFESWSSWIPTMLWSGWASTSASEIAALFLITEIGDEADWSVCVRLSTRRISSPKWENGIDRWDRGGLLSALASRPVPVSELGSDAARSDISLAAVSGSGIQSSLWLFSGNVLADAPLSLSLFLPKLSSI